MIISLVISIINQLSYPVFMKKSLLLFPLFAFQLLQAQLPPAIKNLVFEGAGVRGIAYCGAVQEME